jgi:hypothetical protein
MSASTSETTKRLRVNNPRSLLATTPYLLGFYPTDSLVVIGTDGASGKVQLTLRFDLPDPPDSEIAADISQHALAVLGAQHISAAVAVGYGPGTRVSPVADALLDAADKADVAISDFLRVEDQRYWSYLCKNPACCPPEGTPFTVEGHPAAKIAADAGAPVLASREELAASLSSFYGKDAEVMHAATRHAEEQAARLVARVARSGQRRSAKRLIAAAGIEAVIEAIDTYRRGDRMLAGDALAWLSAMLRNLRVRDDAWARMDPAHKEAHLRLWTDLTRFARPGYIAPAASLLAFVAWQTGNGALANVALDRAVNDNPNYSMAHLLRQAIDSGAPPSMARSPMTPEEVAAVYDADETDTDGDEHQGEDEENDDQETEASDEQPDSAAV